MKKLAIAVVAVAAALPATALAQATALTRDGFGKVRWGISAAELRQVYPAAEQNGDQWVVRGPVAERPAVTTFSFFDGKLYRAYVVFTAGTFKEGVFIEACESPEFEQFKSLLTQKYGAARSERKDWAVPVIPGTNRKVPDAKPEEWLLAGFETAGTSIALGCNPSGMTLLYESKSIAQAAAQAKKHAQLGDL